MKVTAIVQLLPAIATSLFLPNHQQRKSAGLRRWARVRLVGSGRLEFRSDHVQLVRRWIQRDGARSALRGHGLLHFVGLTVATDHREGAIAIGAKSEFLARIECGPVDSFANG